MNAHAECPRLLADVGGTNARFAWQAGPAAPIEEIRILPGDRFDSLEVAVCAYLDALQKPRPRVCAIAIANPVQGDRVRMTNRDWSFSIAELQQRMNWERLVVVNDFTALAMALPTLPNEHRRQVGGGSAQADGAIGLIGPGTGLGVSGLLPNGRGGWVPLQGEGGHVTLSAVTPREQVVVEGLQRRYGHASAERAVSGMGLRDVHAILCEADGLIAPHDWDAARVSAAGLAGEVRPREALEIFCALLGTVAGNLALTLGATGGVYIGGGIVPRLGTFFDESPFRERFKAKGRFRRYLADIPTWVITAPQSPALAGAAALLDNA